MAGNLNFYDKFPAEQIEYDADVSDFLVNADTISSVTAVVLDGGVQVTNPRHVGAIVYFTVSGGTGGSVAHVLVTCNLASGQVRQGLATILIKRLPSS